MVTTKRFVRTVLKPFKHLVRPGFLPFLLWSCQAYDATHGGMTEPGVLASGYWIPDGIAVIGEREFLFADRRGALYHFVDGRVTGVRGLPRSRTSGIFG